MYYLNIIRNRKVEANYTVANGYEHDAKVIYGDTDSVMVRYFPNTSYKYFTIYIGYFCEYEQIMW